MSKTKHYLGAEDLIEIIKARPKEAQEKIKERLETSIDENDLPHDLMLANLLQCIRLRPTKDQDKIRKWLETSLGEDDLPGDLVIGDNGKIRLADDAPDRRRRQRAAGLYLRHYFEGLTLAESWFELHPHKKEEITQRSAEVMAGRELGWLARVYPMDGRALMEAHDLGFANLAESIRELKAMTSPLKVGTDRVRGEDGELHETIRYEERRDIRALTEGIKIQAAVLGLTGAAARPAEPPAPVNVEPETIPTTIEEAEARGEPITLIEHPPEIPPDEWQRQMNEYQEAKRKRPRLSG